MTMRRCCFLSMDSLVDYVCDDALAIGPLRDLGWHVDTLSWRHRSTDWNAYEAVLIRSTWDYQDSPDQFRKTLRAIDASRAVLLNPLSVVEWNLDKRYLGKLEQKGARIVPTLWPGEAPTRESFAGWQEEFGTPELILKPTVSATAQDTFRLSEYVPGLARVFAERQYMVQPFMRGILEEGEFSLFFFNGEFSHAILKSPHPGDFRVQEEHGGLIRPIEPEAGLLAAARRINGMIDASVLYSRIDLVRGEHGWHLMELELIEPALYFRMDVRSPIFFAEQFDRRMNEL